MNFQGLFSKSRVINSGVKIIWLLARTVLKKIQYISIYIPIPIYLIQSRYLYICQWHYSVGKIMETSLEHEQCSIVHLNLWPLIKAITFTFFIWPMHKFFKLRTKTLLLLLLHSNWSCFSNKIWASPLDQYRRSNLSNFADTYPPGATLLIHKVACSGSHNTRSLQRNLKKLIADLLNSAW